MTLSTAKENTTAKTSRQKSSKTKKSAEIDMTNKETNDKGQIIALPVSGNDNQSSLAITAKTSSLLPNNRPVEQSDLEIAETVNMAGIRPIFASDLKITEMIKFSGERPVFASNLKITDTFIGNRPIASNNVDDDDALMGYLD